MCCNKRPISRYALCVFFVIFIHACIILSLVLALTIRLSFFRNLKFNDMASDQRLVNRKASSVFCSNHRIESELDTVGHASGSNNEPDFDLYQLNNVTVLDDLTTMSVKDQLTSFFLVSTGENKAYTFNLMEGSNVTMTMCGRKHLECVANATVWYYVTQGSNKRKNVLKKLQHGEPLIDCADDCIISGVAHLGPCSSSIPKVTMTIEANTTDDYTVVYFVPKPVYSGMPTCAGIDVIYDIDRIKYNLTALKITPVKNRHSKVIDPTDYVILEYNYWTNASNFALYGIVTDYKCDPNVGMYMVIFLLLPLALIVVMGIVVLCCSRVNSTGNLLDSYSENSYGAIRS